MLISDDRRTVISALGWADEGALWVYREGRGAGRSAKLGSAKHFSLHRGQDDHVAIAHHSDDGSVAITVHRFPDIETILARVGVQSGNVEWSGPAEVWQSVPRHYTAHVKTPWWDDFALITIDAPNRSAALQTFPWFDGNTYDKGYHGIVGVAEIPGSDHVLISVQRSSTLIVHDPVAREKAGEVKLAGRAGNPELHFRRNGELWATDYDTLLRLDPATWRILDSRRLQGVLMGTRQFIGTFAMDADERLCLVARPFSSDVVAIDTTSFRTVSACKTGGQPLEAVLRADERVLARDWKTGSMLSGRLGWKRWFGR